MSSLMVSIWTLRSPQPLSISTGQRSKGGDHYPKLSLLHQSSLLLLPQPQPPPPPFLLLPLFSDLSDIVTVSTLSLPGNSTYLVTAPLNFHPPPPNDSRRYISLANASKPQLTYIRVVTPFT